MQHWCSFSTNGFYMFLQSYSQAHRAQLAEQVLLHLCICGCTLLRPIKPRKPIGIDFLLWLVATEGMRCTENWDELPHLFRIAHLGSVHQGMLCTLPVAVGSTSFRLCMGITKNPRCPPSRAGLTAHLRMLALPPCTPCVSTFVAAHCFDCCGCGEGKHQLQREPPGTIYF